MIRSPPVEDRWGNCVQVLEHDDLDDRRKITFSNDGNYIASMLTTGEIVLWEAATGALHSTLDRYKPKVVAIKSLQKGILASMYADGAVRLSDHSTGVLFRTLEPPVKDCQLVPDVPPSPQPIPSLSILPGGDLLVLSQNGHSWIWNWESNAWSEPPVTGIPIQLVYGCLSNGLLVALIGQNNTDLLDLCLLNLSTRQIQTIEANKIGVWEPVAISSLDIIAWQAEDGAVELLDTKDLSRTKLKGHSKCSVSALTFSPDGSMLISGYYDRALISWDLSTQSRCLVDSSAFMINSIAFSPDNKQMATLMSELVKLYRFPVRDMSTFQDNQSGESLHISVSPNGKQIAAGPRPNGMIQIYDTENGELKHTLSGISLYNCIIAFSPNNELIASTSYNASLLVWDLRTGAVNWTISGGQPQFSLRFSPDGRYLVSGGDRGAIVVVDAKSGKIIHILKITTQAASVQFSSNGQRIACFTDRAKVRADASARAIGVWDFITGELVHEIGTSAINGGSKFVSVKATMSPNGRYLAYSFIHGLDEPVVIYDIESKQQLDFPIAPGPTMRSLVFSKDSKSVVTSTRGGGIKQWDLETARLIGVCPLDVWPRWLSFTKTGKHYLEFENGHIPIHPIEGDLSNQPSRHLTHWWYDEMAYWFMEGTRRMLWVPPAYRPDIFNDDSLAHHDGLFVFSNSNGIHYFKFNQGEEVTDPHEHGGNH